MEERIFQLEERLQKMSDLFNQMNAAQIDTNQLTMQAIIQFKNALEESTSNFEKIDTNLNSLDNRISQLEK